MEQLEHFIDQEKKQNPGIQELVDNFLLNRNDKGYDIFYQEVKEFVENIQIDETRIQGMHIYFHNNRKTAYYHLMRNGAGNIFTADKNISEMIYIQFIKFKNAFRKMNKDEATTFTQRMIHLLNESPSLETAICRGEWEHEEGIYFQVMLKEIEKLQQEKLQQQ